MPIQYLQQLRKCYANHFHERKGKWVNRILTNRLCNLCKRLTELPETRNKNILLSLRKSNFKKGN